MNLVTPIWNHIAPPKVAIIIPARNCPDYLAACLDCAQRSLYRNLEIIVVDDASTDGTAELARSRGVKVLQLPWQSGPAAARNFGADHTDAPYLLFVDADVCLHPDTVNKVVQTFLDDPTVGATFGSYDLQPGAPNFLSQYKNLFHHFVHQQANTEATTFWAGCGAVRRQVFLELGGFDLGYGRPCIEDVEFGVRLCKAGHRVVLNKQVQAAHLKRWKLWGMIRTDVVDRAIPWTHLILRERNLPNDLNLKLSQRAAALFAMCLAGALAVASVFQPALLLLPLLLVAGVMVTDAITEKKTVTVWRLAPALLAGAGALGLLAYCLAWWALAPVGLLGAVLLLNHAFYRFFARVRGVSFAGAIVPLHLAYYLYSAMAFALANWSYRRRGGYAVSTASVLPSARPDVMVGPSERKAA